MLEIINRTRLVMTDKELKANILAYIDKEQEGLMDANGNFEYAEHEGAYHALCDLEAFINSIPEEPVSSTHKHEELLEKTVTRLRSIADRTYHITSGNLSHELTCLRGFALRAAEIIDKSLNKD